MSSNPDTYFIGNPVTFGGGESEGGAWSSFIDTSTKVLFIALGSAPSVGDTVTAKAIGGRWVAQLGKSRPKCRWMCGPYVQFDAPTGSGTNCHAALASISVASDGTIAGVTLVDPGACYTVAHPNALVKVDGVGAPGSGATLLATVGEVISLTVTNAGKGYDPANPPAVTIAPPGGTGTTATATASVNPDGTLGGLTITSGGSLYQVAGPVVTIGPPGAGGTQATATATAKPGMVTGLKVTTAGAGYVDNTPPAYLNLTVSGGSWSASLVLTGGYNLSFSGQAGAPGGVVGTLAPCAYSGTTTATIKGVVDYNGDPCPDLVGATVYGAAFYSPTYGWVLQVDVNACQNGILACLAITSTCTDQSTSGGPFGPTGLPGCAGHPGHPYSQSIPVTSDMKRTEPTSAIAWWQLQGGYYLGGNIDTPNKPLAYTFTLSEPSP